MAAGILLGCFLAGIGQVLRPRHQILQVRRISIIKVLHHYSEQMLQILIRFQIVGFCRLNDTVNNSAGLCPLNRVNDMPVGSPNAERAYRSLACLSAYWDNVRSDPYAHSALGDPTGTSLTQLRGHRPALLFTASLRRQKPTI